MKSFKYDSDADPCNRIIDILESIKNDVEDFTLILPEDVSTGWIEYSLKTKINAIKNLLIK